MNVPFGLIHKIVSVSTTLTTMLPVLPIVPDLFQGRDPADGDRSAPRLGAAAEPIHRRRGPTPNPVRLYGHRRVHVLGGECRRRLKLHSDLLQLMVLNAALLCS